MNKDYDFLGKITLLTDVPFPKIHGIRSGYQPHHQFFGLNFLVSGRHIYQDEALHYSGEKLDAQIKILNWDLVQAFVHIGSIFWLYEGSRKIGAGVVTAIAATDSNNRP